MKKYIEMFKNIDLRPCELVAIREIAAEYRRQLLLKYHVSDEKELQPYICYFSYCVKYNNICFMLSG